MHKPAVSIIIPAYNTEKYIKRCVCSILNQSFTDFELIVIDDGSSDDTWKVLSELDGLDKRLRIYHSENGGVSRARNYGLQHASGEWIMFVDSDDELPNDSLKSLYDAISGTALDMVVGNYLHVRENGEKIHSSKFDSVEEWTIDDLLEAFFCFDADKFQGYIWNRLFKTSIFRQYNLQFDEKIKYREDGLLLIQYMLRSKKNVLAIPEEVYIYYDRSDSALGSTKRKFVPALVTNLDARVMILDEIRRYNGNPQNVLMAKRSINKMWRILVCQMLRYKYYQLSTWWYVFSVTIRTGSIFFKPL